MGSEEGGEGIFVPFGGLVEAPLRAFYHGYLECFPQLLRVRIGAAPILLFLVLDSLENHVNIRPLGVEGVMDRRAALSLAPWAQAAGNNR